MFSILCKKDFYTNSTSQNSVNGMETPFFSGGKQTPKLLSSPRVPSGATRWRCRPMHLLPQSSGWPLWENRNGGKPKPLDFCGSQELLKITRSAGRRQISICQGSGLLSFLGTIFLLISPSSSS